MTDLHTIRSFGHKDIPRGSIAELRLGRHPGTVTVTLTLPGQGSPSTYEDLPIADGVVVLPVPLAFLCHAKEDRRSVRALAEKLLHDGVLTWMDEKDLLVGHNWKAEIDKAIERSDYVLVFLSRASCKKTGYFQRELRYALEQQQLRPLGGRFILPVLLEECEPPRELQDIHWLELWQDAAYCRLLTSLSVEGIEG